MSRVAHMGRSAPVLGLAALLAAATLPDLGQLLVITVVVLVLVLLNGLFVAAEFAIIGVRVTQVEQLAEEGNKVAAGILRIRQSRAEQDSFIATAQLGITIASLGLAMYGEPQISHLIEPFLAESLGLSSGTVHTVGYVFALTLLTYLHVVLGEMVPKSMALFDASRSVMWIARPMQVAQKILHYPVKYVNGIGNLLLKLLRVPPAQGHAGLLAAEELEILVSESVQGGMLNEEEEEMIRNIFDFGDRVVGQVMKPRTKLQAIPVDMKQEDVLRIVTESRHSRFPVYVGDLDHILGIVHLKDLIRQTLRKSSTFDIRLIIRPVPTVPEDQPIQQLLAAFKRQKLHMAIVRDEFGGVSGIVTLEDLVEEVVGEVRDEFDIENEPIVRVGEGALDVAGDLLVDELRDEIDPGSEEDLPDVETVGGLIVASLGRPPRVGDVATYGDDVTFEVLSVDGRAVSRARVEYPRPDEEEEGPSDT